MRAIAIIINKGGVGKTTLTKHSATAATAAGPTVFIEMQRARAHKGAE